MYVHYVSDLCLSCVCGKFGFREHLTNNYREISKIVKCKRFGAAFCFNQIGLAYLQSGVPIFHPGKYFKRANYKMHYKKFKTQSNESITNYNLVCFQI